MYDMDGVLLPDEVPDEYDPFLLGDELPELVGDVKVLVGDSEGDMYGIFLFG